MDVFIEQVIKRKRNVKSIAIIVLVLSLLILAPVICCLLAFVITPYFVYIGLFVFIIGIYLAWYFITGQRIEYEYSVASGTLDISKIISKRKRKRVTKIEIADIDLFCKITDKRINERKYQKQFMAAADPNDKENTYCVVYHSTAYGRTILTFTPNEKIREGMKPYLKKEIMLEMFYNRGSRNGTY
ncbi:MAG: hypothetical protein J1E56_01035 [Ruminococcus sp.]|nr:hypothetical protein [Ruminococcus sp.]